MKHPSDIDLALYAGADLTGWRGWRVGRHVRHCVSCQDELASYRQDAAELIEQKSQLPKFVNWDRLAAEMQGNIRVGLAAGECVKTRSLPQQLRWQHVVGGALAAGLLLGAWELNIPRQRPGVSEAQMGPALTPGITAAQKPQLGMINGGVEIRERQGALTMLHNGKSAIYSSQPDALSVSSFNDKTGQITIQTVSYAE